MVQTNIEYFNYNLKLFVNDIIKVFPDLKDDLVEYYGQIITDEDSNEDKFIKRFMRKLSDKKTLISQKDESLFSESIHILKGVDFKELWQNEKLKDSTKATIWDYLQTLYVIGETIVSDSDSIKKLVENFKKVRENKGDTPDTTNDDGEPSLDDADKQMLDMIKNLSDKTKPENMPEINEELINNGLIGNLAKELAEDMNMDDFNLNIDENNDNVTDVFSNLISGDNPMKFMNLIQNVGQKIQNKLSNGDLDQSKLVDEAQTMMGMLGNNNPLFDNLLNKTKTEMRDANQTEAASNPTKDRLRKKLEQRKKNKK